MATFAYLRVSTQDQTTDQQLREIKSAGYEIEPDRVYEEQGVSGKVPALQREQFKRLFDRLTTGDTVIVVRIDRLGRDTVDVITTIETLIKGGIAVVVIGLGTLDGSPQSSLTLTMLAAISQFERQLISERTKAKLAELKAQGIQLGRRPKASNQETARKAKELFEAGYSWRKVAKELKIALSTLQRLMKQEGANHEQRG